MFGRMFGTAAESRSSSYQDVWGSGGDWAGSAGVDKYSAHNALGLSTVVGCIRRRSSLLAQIPFRSFRTDADGFAVEVQKQPMLLMRPSAHVTRSEWLTQMSISRDLFGNAFGWISARDAAGYPTSVDWLSPPHVQPTTDGGISQALTYRVNGQVVPSEQILLIPSSLILPGSPLGIAPLQYSGLVELGKMAQKFGSDWFRNGAVPSQLIYSDMELTADEAEAIRSRVSNSWRARKAAVLGSGSRVESVVTDKQSTAEGFLSTQRMVQSEICNVFGVPPEAFSISTGGSSLTYANREQQIQAELLVSFNDDLVKIQEHLTDALPRPQDVIGVTGALMRSDTKTSWETLAIGIAAGFITVDEARKVIDRRPLPPPADTQQPTLPGM